MSFTPTIERRFRLLFRFDDLNKDGRLDSKDHDELIQRLANVYKTDAAEEIKKESDKWWAIVEKFNMKKSVTEEEYINIVRFLYVKDFTMLRKLGFKLFDATFSLIDHDKDNKISLDELEKYYACFNVTDTDRVKQIFQKLDLDKDGFVTRDEWIIARLDYATREDPDYDFGFMMDFSSPVPAKSSSGRLTPNLLQRYKTIFRFCDANKDGFHTVDDYLLIFEKLCTIHNAREEEREEIRNKVLARWKVVEPTAVDGKISEEHFVYRIIRILVTDFDAMRMTVMKSYRPWFEIADRDGDGLISEDEFLKRYEAFNVNDAEKVKKIFKQVDLDDDGFISEEEFILANLDYWTRDDPTYDYGFLYDVY